jgi:hypothetical protein
MVGGESAATQTGGWGCCRGRIDRCATDRVVLARVIELGLRPGAEHELHALAQAGPQLVEIQPELDDLLVVDPPAHADLEPPTREDVEHCALLREPQRLMEGHDVDHRAQPQSARARGERPQHHVRRRQQVVGGEVVLGQEDPVVPEPFGGFPLLEVLLVNAPGERRVEGGWVGLVRVMAEVEDRDGHRVPPVGQRNQHGPLGRRGLAAAGSAPATLEELARTDHSRHVVRLGAVARAVLELDHRQLTLAAQALDIHTLALAHGRLDDLVFDPLVVERALNPPARVSSELRPEEPAAVKLDLGINPPDSQQA